MARKISVSYWNLAKLFFLKLQCRKSRQSRSEREREEGARGEFVYVCICGLCGSKQRGGEILSGMWGSRHWKSLLSKDT